MPNPFANDYFLRSCVFYEFLGKKSIEKAYRNFCAKVGDDKMSFGHFQFWFDRFSRGETSLECGETRIPISHDEAALRMCMMCQFLQDKEKPIIEAYNRLCLEIGNIIEYEEFEFWFKRFENGSFNLDFDRQKDPSGDIVEKEFSDKSSEEEGTWNAVDRFVIRKTDGIEQNAEQMNSRIEIEICPKLCRITTNHQRYDYKKTDSRMEAERWMRRFPSGCLVQGKSHVGLALGQISEILSKQNPLDVLKIRNNVFGGKWNIIQELRPFFTSLESRIQTKRIDVDRVSEVVFLSVLENVEPRFLEEIECSLTRRGYERIDELVKTEQWKQAKQIRVKMEVSPSKRNFVYCSVYWRSRIVENLQRLRQALFKSPNFIGTLSIIGNFDVETVETALGPFVSRYPNHPEWRSYPIPDTNRFLNFNITEECIMIC